MNTKIQLTIRQRDILNLFRNSDDPITVPAIKEQYPDLSRFSIIRDIKRLIEMGLLRKIGETRGASYALNSENAEATGLLEKEIIREEVHKPEHLKETVFFNEAFLDSYQPNATRFVKPSISDELEKIGKLPDPSVQNKRWIESMIIDLSWASSRYEGSTLSWLETKTLIEYGETALHHKDKLGIRHTLNHKEAIAFILSNKLSICSRDIRDIHALLSKDLMPRREQEGALRDSIVSITGSAYRPLDNPWKVKEAFETFCKKASEINDTFEKAFFVMTMLPYIQPFNDANKRTSRIGMNIPLHNDGYCPFSFIHTDKQEYNVGMAAIYEKNHTNILLDCFIDGYRKGSRRYQEICNPQQTEPQKIASSSI